MKAKARRLANPGDYYKDQEVSSADWSPAPPLKTEMKTGARPIMKPSSKGTGESYAARDTKKAIGADMKRGGFKAGGAVKGSKIPSAKETLSTKEIVGANPIKPTRGKAEHYKTGGRTKKADGGPKSSFLERMVGKPKTGSDMSQVGKMGTANYTQEEKGALNRVLNKEDSLPEPAEAAERSGKYQNYKKGGRAGRADGGNVKIPSTAHKFDSSGKMITPSRYDIYNIKNGKVVGKAKSTTGSRRAVDRRDNEYGAYAHRAVPVYDNNPSSDDDRAERKAGGRTRVKGKTNINIVIAAGRKAGPEAPALDMAAGMP